ncbi:MAG: UDP-N-acetylmuramoyl-L-alanine--D-glutamate ligase [Candidatus Pacebacteria bacterium]|nr:UDP-N-acetylmuramoyl-L-alanine--D-glutamate ligase [Candidatus Paceibacterota bacterium]
MKISQLKNKSIVILGLRVEGLDTYYFLRHQFPAKKLFLADKKNLSDFDVKTQNIFKKDKNIELLLGNNYLSKIKNIEIVIKTSGIILSSIKKNLGKSSIVTSQVELFFDNCKAKIIGITGTKGKSTTSSLAYSLLKSAKIKTYLLGNIGTAPLSFLPKIGKSDIIILELSSHQLQNIQKSPHIAIFLNIYPEHLDYYKNFKEYFNAKANIALYQKKSDYFIFNPDIKEIKNLANKVISKKIPINPEKFKTIINQSNIKKLTHEYNISAILEIAKILKISEKIIKKTLDNFKAPSHRLEYIGEFNGIKFYNDSIATIPEATIFALDTLGEDVETLIAGGLNRGIKFDKIAKRIINSKIKNLILFPDSGKEIRIEIEKLNKNHNLTFFETKNMENAVSFAYKNTSKNKICLLSPASPSFNLFKDYQERGNVFKEEIKSQK